MKVNDLFKIGNKTIFAGTLDTKEPVISKTFCSLEIDGQTIKNIQIDGEVYDGRGHRDLWTCSHVDIDRDLLSKHDVWLTAENNSEAL